MPLCLHTCGGCRLQRPAPLGFRRALPAFVDRSLTASDSFVAGTTSPTGVQNSPPAALSVHLPQLRSQLETAPDCNRLAAEAGSGVQDGSAMWRPRLCALLLLAVALGSTGAAPQPNQAHRR